LEHGFDIPKRPAFNLWRVLKMRFAFQNRISLATGFSPVLGEGPATAVSMAFPAHRQAAEAAERLRRHEFPGLEARC